MNRHTVKLWIGITKDALEASNPAAGWERLIALWYTMRCAKAGQEIHAWMDRHEVDFAADVNLCNRAQPALRSGLFLQGREGSRAEHQRFATWEWARKIRRELRRVRDAEHQEPLPDQVDLVDYLDRRRG